MRRYGLTREPLDEDKLAERIHEELAGRGYLAERHPRIINRIKTILTVWAGSEDLGEITEKLASEILKKKNGYLPIALSYNYYKYSPVGTAVIFFADGTVKYTNGFTFKNQDYVILPEGSVWRREVVENV